MLSESTKDSGPQPHFKELKYNFSPRITNMLQNTERALETTTYSQVFTGKQFLLN